MPPRPDTESVLGRLIAFDTTSSESNLPLVDYLSDLLDRPGVEIRRYGDETKQNLLVRIGPPCEACRGLMLCGHTDTVPAGDAWSSDPFALTDGGDRWLGRGTCDMKGFLALAAECALDVDPEDLAAPLVLLFTYDEEIGSLGARDLCEAFEDPAELPRATVVGEPTQLRAVRAHKGHLRAAVVFEGVSAHSGYPHRGANAIEAAGCGITALAALARELAAERPAGGELFPEVPYEALNLGRIEGGEAVNVVPAHCRLEIGIRLLPGSDPERLLERVRETLEGLGLETPWRLELGRLSPPLETAAESR
ncbi:MAG: M20/M25/M40 family metallo-hydrolase, partial [Thermoanaerobaculia bacterium]|nr:M20/M25/M40 family metallo-hydrolase [Thermoanaerobaculia bacterium]